MKRRFKDIEVDRKEIEASIGVYIKNRDKENGFERYSREFRLTNRLKEIRNQFGLTKRYKEIEVVRQKIEASIGGYTKN